jgi:hypothetical protein
MRFYHDAIKMNISKQQKQILLILLNYRHAETWLKLNEIITIIERLIDNESSKFSHTTSNAKRASFSRSMKRLKKEGLIMNDGVRWYLTNSGYQKSLERKRNIKKYIKEYRPFIS